MSNLSNWIDSTLYPALFDCVPAIFPEHKFHKTAKGWISKTYLNGSPHPDRIDKTKILQRIPFLIFEEGGESKTIIKYCEDRDRLEPIEAIKKLADIAGVPMYQDPDFNTDEYRRYKSKADILEDCNSYFIWCLENSPGAQGIRDYLTKRGYSPEVIKEMGLGYIPSQKQLFDHLTANKKHNKEDINKAISLSAAIGKTHQLSIPWRNGGALKGFNFRSITDEADKYRRDGGHYISQGFFNMSGVKGDKDIVIVEGEFDCLHATVKGIDNVVALGGSAINPDRVRDAIKRGAKMFTICLDNDPGKEKDTVNKVNRIIEVIQGEGVNRIYIVTLPALNGEKTDPDKLIKEQGVEAFRSVLNERQSIGSYLGDILLDYFISKQDENGAINDKERDTLRDRAIEVRASLSPTNRADFNRHLIEPLKEVGFDEPTLQAIEEDYRTAKEEAQKAEKVNNLLREASQTKDKTEAIKVLKEGLKDIDQATGKGLLPETLTFAGLLNEMSTIPPSHKTGYSDLDRFVSFKSAAITLIAGRPSHGKTTFMFNLMLKMSELYRDEVFYFFTYEEPVKNISIKLLSSLIGKELSPSQSNYEFLKYYIAAGRNSNPDVEAGKRKLQELIDSQRIKIIDRNYSVEEIYSLLMYLSKQEKIGAVFIDYIQRMRTERKTQDKRTEIAHISDKVLQAAKDSGIAIILGAQLNRASAGSPKLENLKEAGNLEEDANTVLSVYNESKEKAETEAGESYSTMKEVQLEIKALKNREGEVNRSAILTFEKSIWDIRQPSKYL